jgi:hypothetical protein
VGKAVSLRPVLALCASAEPWLLIEDNHTGACRYSCFFPVK